MEYSLKIQRVMWRSKELRNSVQEQLLKQYESVNQTRPRSFRLNVEYNVDDQIKVSLIITEEPGEKVIKRNTPKIKNVQDEN